MVILKIPQSLVLSRDKINDVVEFFFTEPEIEKCPFMHLVNYLDCF